MSEHKLARIRSINFLARTGDRKSVVSLLQAIGDQDLDISRYSLEAVFNNPQAYQELMDLNSLARMKVIHRFSENDQTRAIQFALDSLAEEKTDIRLLALDVLDHNIASLEKGTEIYLKKLLTDTHERVRVKTSRLLILFADYETIDISDCHCLSIMEKALDSDDLACRQMAFGLPPSLFYKLKSARILIDDLKMELHGKDETLRELSLEIRKLKHKLDIQSNKLLHRDLSFQQIHHENRRLQRQISSLNRLLKKKGQERHQHLKEIENLKLQWEGERQQHTQEFWELSERYQELVRNFRDREEKFKQGFAVFCTKSQAILDILQKQKKELETQLHVQEKQSQAEKNNWEQRYQKKVQELENEKQQTLDELTRLEQLYRQQFMEDFEWDNP